MAIAAHEGREWCVRMYKVVCSNIKRTILIARQKLTLKPRVSFSPGRVGTQHYGPLSPLHCGSLFDQPMTRWHSDLTLLNFKREKEKQSEFSHLSTHGLLSCWKRNAWGALERSGAKWSPTKQWTFLFTLLFPLLINQISLAQLDAFLWLYELYSWFG